MMESSQVDPSATTPTHGQTQFPPIYQKRTQDDGEIVSFDARPILPRAAFFMGDLRDGLPMLNMQAAFLASSKAYTKKQLGALFFTFGMSQFIFMAPSGYFLDYSNNKIKWVIWAGVATASLTVITALTALPFGENIGLQICLKVLQGAISTIIPTGFNGVTLGIVGSTGFTYQVSRNRMMNHIGTAIIVAIGSLIAFGLYPKIGLLFMVSPLAAVGMWYNLQRIKPDHVDKDAARGLILESPTMTEYEEMDDENVALWIATGGKVDPCGTLGCSHSPTYIPPDIVAEAKEIAEDKMATQSMVHTAQDDRPTVLPEHKESENNNDDVNPIDKPDSSYSLWGRNTNNPSRRAQTLIGALTDPSLLIFTCVVFFFHLANSSVLPLVMQNLALSDPQAGILLSSLCILIAQVCMAFFAKICGDYSPIWGRKVFTLVALLSLTVRCFLLTFLVSIPVEENENESLIKALILSTQFLDSVGAGLFGTLHVLITNDISNGTGRFSLMLGVTTGAMCLGGTVSGYFGQALAQDYGYASAFSALGMISLIPFLMYLFAMPETLPNCAKPKPRRKRLQELLQKIKEQGFRNAFRRKAPVMVDPQLKHPGVQLV